VPTSPGSAPRPVRSRRSCLAIPGSNDRMLEKARGLPADQVFLDLEDAVPVDGKVAARQLVVEALNTPGWAAPTRVVRINDVTSPWALGDLLALVRGAGGSLDGIVLPKVDSPAQVHFVDLCLHQLELEAGLVPGSIGLELQIETAGGLRDAADILAASARIEALTFGPGDLAVALGMPATVVGGPQPDYPGDHWHHVRSSVVVQARAAGVQALDGPYAAVHDLDGFRELARRSRSLGFDGTWVLHPGQIVVANEVYGVNREEYERAVDQLDAWDAEQQAQGRGAVMFGREMIDEATRRQAEVCVRKGRAEGVTARPVPDQVPFHERVAWRAEHLDDGLEDTAGAEVAPPLA
jgi:citrate lyase subunit beta / citryl-CoA lyase